MARPVRLRGVLLLIALFLLIAGALGVLWMQHRATRVAPAFAPLAEFNLDARPRAGQYLFDYGGRLEHYREGAERYLDALRQQHGIEALIVTLADLPPGYSLDTLAADLMNRWRIGADTGGRGLLLLLIDSRQQARLEVGYALEPLFTDAFSGYIEDLQLGAYYRANDLGTGLIAVMEEIEARAQLQPLSADLAAIAQADSALLSGGAGAQRNLETYRNDARAKPAVATHLPSGAVGIAGAATPDEAWQSMLRQWAGKSGPREPDIYTAMTRQAMGDPQHPDPRVIQALAYWQQADYEVLQDDGHALIWFGQREGWNNAPFLFCRGATGWQFDIVHQRILVVMGAAPHWYVAAGDYPYLSLLKGVGLSSRKDMPPVPALRYRCSDDAQVLGEMERLQQRLHADPNDQASLLELARLRISTAQRPNLVQPLLDRLLAREAVAPAALQYAAVYQVNAFLQYRTALGLAERYSALRPQDAWGHNMQGFVHYRLSQFEPALQAHQRALALDPDSGYAHGQLARIYTQLYRRGETAVQRTRYRRLAEEALGQAKVTGEAGPVTRLSRWVEARLD
ncbi:TPM domain-containing protein [Marinobacterium rhizophilum]|uniref:TPM domain-containing protein n=1 Tax=Marinobacterium rhizophilum TaxID=420402 RepID=A0ABY5HJT6_9GAMM|nr:TPM domain-containing protein [Marinobacterium rhizophilum]UTW11522.1 TPM domain-containing protein [Marinobacterium rhizophilum]